MDGKRIVADQARQDFCQKVGRLAGSLKAYSLAAIRGIEARLASLRYAP